MAEKFITMTLFLIVIKYVLVHVFRDSAKTNKVWKKVQLDYSFIKINSVF